MYYAVVKTASKNSKGEAENEELKGWSSGTGFKALLTSVVALALSATLKTELPGSPNSTKFCFMLTVLTLRQGKNTKF